MEIKSQINNLKSHKLFLEVKKLADDFLQKNYFNKVDIPLLSPKLIPESYLEVFEIKHLYFDIEEKLYLIPSP